MIFFVIACLVVSCNYVIYFFFANDQQLTSAVLEYFFCCVSVVCNDVSEVRITHTLAVGAWQFVGTWIQKDFSTLSVINYDF